MLDCNFGANLSAYKICASHEKAQLPVKEPKVEKDAKCTQIGGDVEALCWCGRAQKIKA